MPIPGGPYITPPVAPMPPVETPPPAAAPARAEGGLAALLRYLGGIPSSGSLAQNAVRAQRRARFGEIPGWSTPYQTGQQAQQAAAGASGVSAPSGGALGGHSGGLSPLLAYLSRFS